MRVFCDTSVLIPLFYGDHPHHEASIRAVEGLRTPESYCGSHSLVETYSSLTRMPRRYRATAERARLFVASLREKFEAVALTSTEYFEMLDQNAAAGITGGSIYDALLARCATKADAEVLLTWNGKHFSRFGSGIIRLVKSPLELLNGSGMGAS